MGRALPLTASLFNWRSTTLVPVTMPTTAPSIQMVKNLPCLPLPLYLYSSLRPLTTYSFSVMKISQEDFPCCIFFIQYSETFNDICIKVSPLNFFPRIIPGGKFLKLDMSFTNWKSNGMCYFWYVVTVVRVRSHQVIKLKAWNEKSPMNLLNFHHSFNSGWSKEGDEHWEEQTKLL